MYVMFASYRLGGALFLISEEFCRYSKNEQYTCSGVGEAILNIANARKSFIGSAQPNPAGERTVLPDP